MSKRNRESSSKNIKEFVLDQTIKYMKDLEEEKVRLNNIITEWIDISNNCALPFDSCNVCRCPLNTEFPGDPSYYCNDCLGVWCEDCFYEYNLNIEYLDECVDNCDKCFFKLEGNLVERLCDDCAIKSSPEDYEECKSFQKIYKELNK